VRDPAPQVVEGRGGHRDLEHEERDGDGEDTVAEGLEPSRVEGVDHLR
jgi:hypothetical protein